MMLRFKSLSNLSRFAHRPQKVAFISNRMFSTQVPASQNVSELDDLEQQALNIQTSINRAQANILEKTKTGRDLSLQISQGVQRDHFVKKQRYDIFITKMEQLQRADKREKSNLKKTIGKMQNAFVSSQQPLKDVLHYYNKAAVKGFDSALVSNTLEQIKLTMRARGNRPRVYDDYTTREFDLSWRMHLLSDHIKLGLGDEIYFNHYHMANSARQLGEIGFKDVQIIQKSFDKLNAMLTERENGKTRMKKPLDIEKVLYGNYLNFTPKHYVYDGFESSQEFKEHLRTLLDWQNERADTLQNLEIEETEVVLQLEQSLSELISASHQVKNMQVEMQASIDSLRTQFFKLQAASNKHAFLQENQHIHFDMLELQELLVKGGYLSPDEADRMSARHPHKVRMERAAEIFYDYVQNYAPELVSPQYDEIFDAAQSTLKSRNQPFSSPTVPLDEAHDRISLSSLSKALTGLSQQALSFRREANDQDYLHKFYEERAMKDEITEGHALDDISHIVNTSTVKMARDYLKAYDIFDREVERIWPRYKKLIKQSADDLEGQLHCLLGLSRCKIEAPDLRSQVYKNIKKCIEQKQPMRLEAAVDGLYGIALQNKAVGARDVVSKLLDFLGSKSAQAQNRLSFQQKLEVVWSACALGFENKPIVRDLYSEIQEMEFQRTDNDLTYDQFQLVRDFQLYLTKVSKFRNESWVQAGRNDALEHLCLQPDLHAHRYEESTADFDPFKQKVLEALTRGLTMASIDHQSTLENNLFDQKQQEVTFNDEKYPYNPDAIVGLGGSKVLLNVIPASETMRDIKKGDGRVQFRARITAGLQDTTEVQSMAVPITSVIDYDIANMRLELKEKYNFAKDLKQQIQFKSKPVDFGQLSAFGAAFTGEAAQYLAALKAPGDKKRVDAFFKQLYHLFQVKQQTDRQYETPVIQQGHQSMKIELMKLNLLWDSMPTHQKTYIGQFVPGSDFKAMILAVKDGIQAKLDGLETQPSAEKASKLDLQWIGTRQTVELPQSAKFKAKKNIVPEIINQRFMWVDDYFHYEDWAETQKNVFDGFNLLVVPRQDNDFKWFYNRDQNHRIVPQGIFPPPNHKRAILQSGADVFANQTIEAAERGNDALNEFEKEPFKTMVLKEQQRSQKLAALTDEVSFMTNLQNIKQGLKQDYSDKEILDLILANLSFTDGLIEEHLGSKQGGAPKFVARNAENYREFVKSTYFSKDQEDPFTHFYIQESGKQERVHKTYRDQQEQYLEQMENAPTEKMKEGVQKIMQTLTTKIEDMLLQNRRENEDLTSLSHQLDSEVKINYDLKSLMKSEYVYDIDPECVDPEISDALFLRQQRKRAETKLIKTKIIYKMDSNLELSENEKLYLQNWVSHLQNNKSCNVGNHRDSMLPQAHSGQKIGKALSAEDVFALNQIPNVQIQRKKHGDYALNDLVLELSHFLDEEVVNRVEMEIMSDRIRNEWKLPSDFKIIETRNKEIGITLNELEEVAWRMSGIYTDSEIDTLKAMFSINRNRDSFDKAFYSSDMQSMENFVREANFFDDRDQLIQEWLVRKEKEIQSRVNLPPAHLRKTDQELHQQIDKKLKRAREKMVTQFLTKDEFGKKAVKRDYKDLTTGELNRISESICVRLNLFDGKYPAFMPQAVKAVMDHPNLANSDRQKLDTFSTMFELDWRGDRNISNKNEFLATNPVHMQPADQSNFQKYGNIGNFEATTLLRLACVPFVESLAQDMISVGKRKDQKKNNKK